MKYEVLARHKRVEKGTLMVHPTATIGRGCSIDVSADVRVGAFAVLSEGVMVLTHDHFKNGKRQMVYSDLVIGANAFIGARAIILESCGVIGDAAVIGAGAVVTRDVPAFEVWAGNPAKRIGGSDEQT